MVITRVINALRDIYVLLGLESPHTTEQEEKRQEWHLTATSGETLKVSFNQSIKASISTSQGEIEVPP